MAGVLEGITILDLTWGKAFIFGVVIGGIGQLGDLLSRFLVGELERLKAERELERKRQTSMPNA